MTLAELEIAKAESLKEIAAAADTAAVEALRVKYVGRNGSIPALITHYFLVDIIYNIITNLFI